MALQVVTLLVLFSIGQLEATLQRDILTFINDLRSLHSAGPLISSPTATALAQKAAVKLAKDGDTSAVYNSQFSTNHCVFQGKLSHLAKTCTVAWYTTMRDHSWCSPRANGKSRPFVNMVWNTTSRAGTGIAKGQNGKYYVVTYLSPKKGSDVKRNVYPIKIVTKASQKAICAKGFTRFGSSCFKFHPEKVSWEQAVTICAKENATLTSVRNQKEEKFLRILQERGKGKGWMWIGLHDRTNEGHFAWLDGLEFANGVCAPVSANGGKSQNCVAWTTNKPISCWSDKTCADRYPFMCRMPVEGKATFRTEILFLKFRWNPNFKNQNSKAFRDLRRGLRVTFNEVLQRGSGKIGGGFRTLKVKSVRPLSIKGKRRGTAVTLSIQFRAKVADPTLKFQKFLRPNSERLISITVDPPDVHQSAIARTMCSFPCRRKKNHYCHSWSYYSHHGYNNAGYHNTAYQNTAYQQPTYTGYDNTVYGCPSSCSQYTYSTCPSYCTHSCCTQTSPTTASPTQGLPTATKPPTKPKPVVPTAVVHAPAPAPAAAPAIAQSPVTPVNQWGSYSLNPAQNQCGTCTYTSYNSPYCYSFCDESCCKHPNKLKHLKKTVKTLRKQLHNFQAIVKYGKSADLPESAAVKIGGNVVPMFGGRAKEAMRILKRNIAKLEDKIKKLNGKNDDDLLFEKEIEKAEKETNDNNGLPDFEKELAELDSDADNIDIANSNMTSEELEKKAEKDMQNFDLEEDENTDHESHNSYSEKDHEYNGPSVNTSTSGNESHGPSVNTSTSGYESHGPSINVSTSGYEYYGPSVNKSTSGNEYHSPSVNTSTSGYESHGPSVNTSTNGYESHGPSVNTSTSGYESHGPSGPSSTYRGPSTNASYYETGHNQVREENRHKQRGSSHWGMGGPMKKKVDRDHVNTGVDSAPTKVSYEGPTTNVRTESYDKNVVDDLNDYHSKPDRDAATSEHDDNAKYLTMNNREDSRTNNSDTGRDGDMKNTHAQDNQASYPDPNHNRKTDTDGLRNSTLALNAATDSSLTTNATLAHDDIANNKDLNARLKLHSDLHKKESKDKNLEHGNYGKYIAEIHKAAGTDEEIFSDHNVFNEDIGQKANVNETTHINYGIPMKDYDTFVSDENNINATHTQERYKYL